MAKVLVLQHTPPEILGTISDALDRAGVSAQYIRGFQGEPIPRELSGAGGLIVMGGPMGVHDRNRMLFLKEELNLIESALKAGKPILGVCLGSQLLAHALGARVSRADRKEIGWHLVRLTEEGKADPLFSGVESSFFAMHWHGDVFNLPTGAVPLAFSEQTPLQAFRHGRNAYGLLFHLEITENIIREMIRTFSDELSEENLDGGWLLEKEEEHRVPLERIGEKVFGHWTKLVR
ncbi:MAG: type 1 glutamine amidotransferase [Candidatus Omnitrophica bacterium]|nr:type 1 glutamine amidotransferase [Candidatus Omnitrophota bacterium]